MTESPLAKGVIVAVFLLILGALGSAFLSLFRGSRRDETSAVKALTVRVALSAGLLILILVLYALGIISPNG